MAKIILTSDNSLFKIAKDQTFIDQNKNWSEADYNIFDITTNQFNDLKNGVIVFNGVTNNVVNFLTWDGADRYKTEQELKDYINEFLQFCENYLIFNSTKPLITDLQNWMNYLKNLDTSSFTFAMTE